MSIDGSSAVSTEKLLMISSDGHATARMPDYKPYLPARLHEEFDDFCAVYRERGARNNEPAAMNKNFDPEVVALWIENVIDPGRLEGTWDVDARFAEMAGAGLAAEVIFPDFGLPFELYSPLLSAAYGYQRTPEQVDVGNRAYNRWLVDFCSAAPDRFAGMAAVSFDDVDAAVAEIRWAREAGLRGVLLPMFSEDRPVFHERFEPIWSTLEELEMPINSHTAISGTTTRLPTIPPLPDPSIIAPIMSGPLFFFCQQLLSHLVWGGVLERHPNLQVVLTEQGSGWVVAALQGMDYSWEGSYLRRDVRNVVKLRPSEYFERQCHLGSSIFSRAEIKARHEISVGKIALGMDFPHPEGTWGLGPGHLAYLRATLGAALVAPAEIRRMVGENAADLWGFNRRALQPFVDQFGPSMDDVAREPEGGDEFPRGDVHKPLSLAK